MDNVDVKKILNEYEIKANKIEKIESTNDVYKIDDNKNIYILKEIKNINKLDINIEIANILESEEIKVSKPIKTKNDKLYVMYNDKYYYLSNYIEGKPYSNDYIDNKTEYIKVYGETLARLHDALDKVDFSNKASEMDIIHDVFNWAIPSIKDNYKIDDLFIEIEELLNKEFTGIVNNLKYQYIHRDYHPGNVLFKDGNVSGLIDFDITVKGLRIFDVCYFLTSALAGRFKNETKRNKWTSYIDQLIHGYENINTLDIKEKESMWYIMLAIELIFAAWFIEIKDTENIDFSIELLNWIYRNKEKITYNEGLKY